ncbi:MAG: pyridoxamine 5'-phosphate oxidase [Opitutaceae bacterium]|nr:pyridoxamine 5'-phosphate oxidase [Opitutaceae bacterium]
MDLRSLRKEYTQSGLTKSSLDSNPIKQFETWFGQVRDAGIVEPNAMSLTTVGAKGEPSVRTVLLKGYDDEGFVFYTNYQSAKARDIEENNRVALLFPWLALERQVIIRGIAEKVSTERSLEYFSTRPRGSQLGAWVSEQSKILTTRAILENKLAELEKQFAEDDIPLPNHWGGFRVQPHYIEFWQGRPKRLHDRLRYEKAANGHWEISRKSP